MNLASVIFCDAINFALLGLKDLLLALALLGLTTWDTGWLA
jgi:hypothetical protein